jgi:hypothetical protein
MTDAMPPEASNGDVLPPSLPNTTKDDFYSNSLPHATSSSLRAKQGKKQQANNPPLTPSTNTQSRKKSRPSIGGSPSILLRVR